MARTQGQRLVWLAVLALWVFIGAIWLVQLFVVDNPSVPGTLFRGFMVLLSSFFVGNAIHQTTRD